ncbi:MAG: chorismate-binding protein, partial [Flavobacteriales bacterium]
PDGGFDFNVVIRSLNYFPKEKYLQCGVGSAITISAKPEQEFEECLIKINRLVKTVYDD